MVLTLRQHLTQPEGLFKHSPLEPMPRVSDSVGLGRGPMICISRKFPGDADAAGRGRGDGEGPHLEAQYLVGSGPTPLRQHLLLLFPHSVCFSQTGHLVIPKTARCFLTSRPLILDVACTWIPSLISLKSLLDVTMSVRLCTLLKRAILLPLPNPPPCFIFHIVLLNIQHTFTHICTYIFCLPPPTHTRKLKPYEGEDFVLFTDMSRVSRTVADTQ